MKKTGFIFLSLLASSMIACQSPKTGGDTNSEHQSVPHNDGGYESSPRSIQKDNIQTDTMRNPQDTSMDGHIHDTARTRNRSAY